MFAEILERRRKRKHLKNKIDVTDKKIWDLEFLVEKMKAQREGFRQEYDRVGEMMDAAVRRLEDEKTKEDPDKSIVENLEALIARYQPDVEQLKAQMNGIDAQLEDKGDGTETLASSIDGLRTIKGMLIEHLQRV